MKCTKYLRIFTLAAILATGIVGCNLFNPTNSEHIDEKDTSALVYEGYLRIQKAEYTKAAGYFSKAIAVDSACSDAWYGLAKAVLNQYNLNVFEMLKYAKTENKKNAFMEMPDSSAEKYHVGIDTVLKILDKFIYLDTTNATDKRITFKNFANSYTILQLTNVAILIRKTQSDMSEMFDYDTPSGQISINWSDLQNLATEDAIETVNAFASSAQALKADPDNTVPIFRNFVPDVDTLSDEELKKATMAIADQVIEMSEILNENADRTDVFFKVGNGMDDDGDGCVDEEVWDGKDNDGDGEIDEDLRPNTVLVFKNSLSSRVIMSLQVPKGSIYETLDIDMNGTPLELAEWQFIYEDPNDREKADDHRLKFATNLVFKADGGDKIKNKELVRKDTDINHIKYDLAWRKENVGGCWVNYTEEDFVKWFEGRN